MATNENVNKVIYGNQTVMDITDTTAEESDVASGEVFYKANGARSVGTLNADSAVWGNITGTLSDQTDLQIELNRAYTKTASETSSIDDLDVIPVQKISASSDGRRNIKFRNLKSILKTYFDNIYSTFSGSYNDLSDKPTVDQTYSATSSNAQSGTAVAEAISSIHGGGMLPYLYIDSEAGATVTVNQPDGTTITPTAAGSGHWECELTGGYGTYVIHSVLSGQGDATLSLAVDTVKEYHVTDTHYDYTINVTAPSGSSVRITGGGETYTGTGTGSSQAFAVHTPSTTYTVAVTMDGNTKSETITSAATSGQSGSVTIAFGTINLTYANDFRGKTITCTKSGVTVTKTAPSGGNTMTFRVPTTGTWTISGTVSGQTYSTTATVTALGTPVSTSLQTVPDGSTVLPTDVIQTWLNCAGIYDKAYTTLSQVLADSTTLLALMSDNNAVDYLVRSTTWATDICADSTAMTDIGANNYCANTLLADEDWCEAICNSTYFESVVNSKVPIMTSNTTPSGICSANSEYAGYEAYQAFNNNTYGWSPADKGVGTFWFQYDFGKTIKPVIMEIKNRFTSAVTNGIYQVSNDMTDWVTVQEFSLSATMADFDKFVNYESTAYRYHRITATYSGNAGGGMKAQFYGREDV